MKDYTDLVADMWNAYGADPFDWGLGAFQKYRELDAGSFSHPRPYRYAFQVVAHQKTRDALIERGHVEVVPCLHKGSVYRLTKAACEAHKDDRRDLTPSWRAWRGVHEAEEYAHKHRYTGQA